MKRSSKYLFLSSLLISGLSPLLMAPGNLACPTCSVGKYKSVTQPLSCYKNRNHQVTMTVLSGSAGLSVNGGPVSGLSCDTEGAVHICSFTALYDGSFNTVVSGTPGPATYNLEHYWND